MSGENRGGLPEAGADTPGLAELLERGPLETLEALKTKIAAVATRGAAAVGDFYADRVA